MRKLGFALLLPAVLALLLFNFAATQEEGGLKWSYDTKSKTGIVSPLVADSGMIYFIADKFYALTPQGAFKWSYDAQSMDYSPPALGKDGMIYFGSGTGNLYAITAKGALKWSYRAAGDKFLPPYVCLGKDGMIYGAAPDANFFALNPDGTPAWSRQTGVGDPVAPALGDDAVYSANGTTTRRG